MSNIVRKIMTGLALAAATSITLLMPASAAAATTTHSAAVACPTSSDGKLINAATATASSQLSGEVCQLTDQRLCQDNIYYYGYLCQICDRGVCSQPYFRWVDHGVRCYP